MSVLPNQILPINTPWLSADGRTIDKNWWLFLYNLATNTLGDQGGVAAAAGAQLQAEAASDAVGSDLTTMLSAVAQLAQQMEIPDYVSHVPSQLWDIPQDP